MATCFFSRRVLVTELTNNYELVTIYSPEASQDETDDSIKVINEFVSSNDGVVSEHDEWGMKTLAFPIKKFTEGNYSLIKFTIFSLFFFVIKNVLSNEFTIFI